MKSKIIFKIPTAYEKQEKYMSSVTKKNGLLSIEDTQKKKDLKKKNKNQKKEILMEGE